MRSSNDLNQDKLVDLSTLGVVDLDTSITPDVFGLRAFLNLVCVLVPDATAGPMGFHDIILEDLTGTPDYRARRIVPSDVIALRRRWPPSLFVAMHKRQADMEFLRRACKRRYESEFGGGRAGTCPHCGVYIICNLSRHVMDHHLELGQLWRCPVEWCSVWKGSVQDCLDHLRSKHDGTQFMGLKTLGNSPPPPWTVSRDSWVATDVKLFHECGCRLVHRYRIFRNPMPHVSLRGKVIYHKSHRVCSLGDGGGPIDLYLLATSSGSTTRTVAPECFPVFPFPHKSRRVSFASDVEVMVSPSTLPSPEVEPDSPDRPLPSRASLLSSVPDTDSNQGQDVFVITLPAYVLFPFPDPLMMMPQLPSWSSFIWPGSPSQSLPGWARPEILDTGSDMNRLPSVISPIAHIPSGDPCVTGIPV